MQLIHEMVNRLVICGRCFKAWFKVNERFTRFGMPKFALIIGFKCSELPRGFASDSNVEDVLTVIEIWMYRFTMMICHCLTLQLTDSISR